MTLDELKEDVSYHCKSIHPRDNTAQTRIAKVLPELLAILEAVERQQGTPEGRKCHSTTLCHAFDAFNSKLESITSA